MGGNDNRFKEVRWDLGKLIPDEGAAFSALEEAAARLEGMRDRLRPDITPDEFLEMISALEALTRRAQVLGGYAHLRFASDTLDQGAVSFLGRAEQALAEVQNRVLFIELWWKALDEKNAERLLKHTGDVKYYLIQQRLFKDYTLSEKEEKIINIKDLNGIHALNRIYEMITSKFTFTLKVEGEEKSLNRDELMAYAKDPSADIREATYREMFRVYEAEEAVLGQIYVNRVRDWANENISVRGFGSPIAVRNLSNDISGEVVDALLEACRENAGVLHRYFRYKAGLLKPGSKRLRRFDLYAPAGEKPLKRIPYYEAVSMVLETLEGFSPVVSGHARAILDSGQLDAEIRPGKRGGAFCLSILPETPPWILCNYTGEPRQVATLAHELGHGIHSMMAGGHSVLTFHSALPLAETASVFSEMLLTERMLKESEDDTDAWRDIIMSLLDDIYATVLRQAFFVLFEREAHRMAAEGATIGELDHIYMKNLKAQFGDAVEVDDIFRHEWKAIPHIYHAPFYCYAYSFGLLLSLSLYERYRKEGKGFVPVFLDILASGGAESPADILSRAGVDVSDPGFWSGGFSVVEGLVINLIQDR